MHPDDRDDIAMLVMFTILLIALMSVAFAAMMGTTGCTVTGL